MKEVGCERAYDSWALFLGVGRNFLRTPRLHVDDFEPDWRDDYVTNKHDVCSRVHCLVVV